MKYGPDKTKEIADYLEGGSSRTDACLLADISYETFTVWMQKPEFSESIKKSEAKCKFRNIGIIQKAAINTWQAAAWWLERKHWQEFALHKKEEQPSVDDMKRLAQQTIEFMKQLNANGLPTTTTIS